MNNRLNLSKDNPYNGMTRSEFLAILDSLEIPYEDGNGSVVYEEDGYVNVICETGKVNVYQSPKDNNLHISSSVKNYSFNNESGMAA